MWDKDQGQMSSSENAISYIFQEQMSTMNLIMTKGYNKHNYNIFSKKFES